MQHIALSTLFQDTEENRLIHQHVQKITEFRLLMPSKLHGYIDRIGTSLLVAAVLCFFTAAMPAAFSWGICIGMFILMLGCAHGYYIDLRKRDAQTIEEARIYLEEHDMCSDTALDDLAVALKSTLNIVDQQFDLGHKDAQTRFSVIFEMPFDSDIKQTFHDEYDYCLKKITLVKQYCLPLQKQILL